MNEPLYGRLLAGDVEVLRTATDAWAKQPIDLDLNGRPPLPYAPRQTTLERAVTVQGPGTFFGKALRTIALEPCADEGWWVERSDLPGCLPTRVSVRNVWTTGQIVSNIVLRSGEPHNYVRMVEHLIALRLGLGIDNLLVRIDSGDPPLFQRGSLDLVEAMERGGVVETARPVRYVTVREPVSICSPHGAFVILKPCQGPRPQLNLDTAIDFPTAIGRQRLRFVMDAERFRTGAVARTNTSAAKKLYCQTVGRIFADIRNLGYTYENILVAGRRHYVNEPRLVHEGKALEAVWHRAALDLLAALALIEEGRFVGEVISYKAGHALDVQMVIQLYRQGLLTEFTPTA